MLKSLAAFWRGLGELDAVWLLGPHPLVIAFAFMALLRRKRVVLGVRQDLPTYTRTRHPDRGPWSSWPGSWSSRTGSSRSYARSLSSGPISPTATATLATYARSSYR